MTCVCSISARNTRGVEEYSKTKRGVRQFVYNFLEFRPVTFIVLFTWVRLSRDRDCILRGSVNTRQSIVYQ